MLKKSIAPVLVLLCMHNVGCFVTQYEKGVTAAKEKYLQAHLQTLRDAIASYTRDRDVPPQTLQDLVTAGYVSMIPDDPITEQPNWTVVLFECAPEQACRKGIKEVRSSSNLRSSDGRPYRQW